MFSPAGLSFGKEEAYLINCALKKLAEDKNAERIRFWGKILTQTQDYFVAQGYTKDTSTNPPTGDMEKLKEGANYHAYWVTQNIRKYHII